MSRACSAAEPLRCRLKPNPKRGWAEAAIGGLRSVARGAQWPQAKFHGAGLVAGDLCRPRGEVRGAGAAYRALPRPGPAGPLIPSSQSLIPNSA